jgi:ribosomal protein S18 acetylase RimI-like enzyme
VIDLRPLARRDIQRLAAWLPGAARAAGCDLWADTPNLSTAIKRDDVLVDGSTGAFLHIEAAAPHGGEARVHFLAVDPEQRRLGLGGRVALTLEELLRGSAERIYVAVPADFGLALYFWLRLGYRPLTQREWPTSPERGPSVWMVRELAG